MVQLKVLDTGVLLGMCIEIDQHHEKCLDYVIDGDCETVYITPTVGTEFEKKCSDIRQKLSRSITEHRQNVVKKVGDDNLSRKGLQYIRDSVLDWDNRAYRFLYKYYSKKMKNRMSVDKLEILMDLEDMETEVWEDACEEHGGWKSLVSGWTKGMNPYSKIEDDLLIHEGDDPDVCLEAHHVAVETGKITELGTTNPTHFIDRVDDEKETRKDNILRLTDLEDIIDLSCQKLPASD